MACFPINVSNNKHIFGRRMVGWIMLTLRGEIMARPMTKIVNGDDEIVREMTEEDHQEFLDNQEFLAQHHAAVAAAK